MAAIGEGWCFFANGVSYIAVISGLFLMRLALPPQRGKSLSAFADITEGLSFVRRMRPVRALLLLLGLVSVMGMPYTVLMPIFADQILHGGPQTLGLLMGAAGLGALLGGASLAARRGVQGLGNWVAFASAGFGTSLILFSLSRSFWLSIALLVPVGFSMMVQMASSNTLIQSMAPDNLRGRLMAFYSMMFMGMAPFGALLAGALAEPLGTPATIALGGVACIVGGGLFWARLPVLRAEGRQLMLAQQMTPGNPAEEHRE